MRKFKYIVACALAALTMATPGLVFAAAACATGNTTPQGQVLEGVGQTGSDCTGQSVTSIPGKIVSILSLIVGVVAVIMIIISGLKYVTSAGDSNGISSAKNTLVYALVGLAVAAVAQVLVRFVLFQVK